MSISTSFSVQQRSIAKWYEMKHVKVVLDCGLCSDFRIGCNGCGGGGLLKVQITLLCDMCSSLWSPEQNTASKPCPHL